MKSVITILVLALLVLGACTTAPSTTTSESADAPRETGTSTPPAMADTPSTIDPSSIDPADFTTEITNPYFRAPPGTTLIYEAEADEGLERIEVIIPGWTKEIMGVTTLVFWDRVYLDGTLIEDTRDYIAQDLDGNVWYFGEDVDNYANGRIINHDGAWIAGIDGAEPGIWMLADPQVGDEYRQEHYAGEAEDMARVDSVSERVRTPAGQFTNCIKIYEWTPLDDATAYKYHCAESGTVVLEEEGDERVELIEVHRNSPPTPLPDEYAEQDVLE